MSGDTNCRKCGRTIIFRGSDGAWQDSTRDPNYCPSAIDFRHAPPDANLLEHLQAAAKRARGNPETLPGGSENGPD